MIIALARSNDPAAFNYFVTHLSNHCFGINVNNEKVSAIYDNKGVNISYGSTATRESATTLSYDEIFTRIREMLADGVFTSEENLKRVDEFESKLIAENIVNHFRDTAEKNNCLPVLCKELTGIYGYPDMVERVKELLKDEDKFRLLKNEYLGFSSAVNRGEIKTWKYIEECSVPFTEFLLKNFNVKKLDCPVSPEFSFVPKYFISDDEKSYILCKYTNIHNQKEQISDFFYENKDLNDRANFVKDAYGLGGMGSDYNVNHDSKGFSVSRCEAICNLTWTEVVKIIDELIAKNKYLM